MNIVSTHKEKTNLIFKMYLSLDCFSAISEKPAPQVLAK
jgi:hypothetical protein